MANHAPPGEGARLQQCIVSSIPSVAQELVGDRSATWTGCESIDDQSKRSSKHRKPRKGKKSVPELASDDCNLESVHPAADVVSEDDFDSTMVRFLQQQIDSQDATNHLSREERLSNIQAQDDEILALEAIFEGSFKLIDVGRGETRAGLISVRVQITECLDVVVDMAHPSSASSSDVSKNSSAYSFSVQHLPNISLGWVFPESYPSHSPPFYTLHAHWLSTKRLLQLAERLDQISAEMTGEVVIYAWVEFLQEQALSFLGVSNKLELQFYEDIVQPPRVFSWHSNPQNGALFLLRHNEEMQLESFNSCFHDCNVCLNELSGKEFIKLPCEHFFCRQCMERHASIHVADGSVNRINCPDTGCSRPIPPYVLKQLLDEQTFGRWEKLTLQKSLDSMPDVVYCPRCSLACIEDKDHHVLCGKCFFSFCSLCRYSWHAGQECATPEIRLRIIQERRMQGLRTSDEQLKKEEEITNELLNMQLVKRECVRCPSCGMAIFKTGGCNKMICTNCKTKFCFICQQVILDYDHFRNASCKLFNEEELREWQAQMDDRQAAAYVQAQFYPGLLVLCPNCRQANPKLHGNNHIFCWSCQSHYCALCKKMVRRASEHFGPNKCKQHS